MTSQTQLSQAINDLIQKLCSIVEAILVRLGAPLAVADVASVAEDNVLTGNVLSNDIDLNDVLKVTKFTVGGVTYNAGQTANIAGVGTVILNANGTYKFTPAANYNGNVPAISYTITDGCLTSKSTLSITVTPVNDAPVAKNDVATGKEDTKITGNVLANDTDVDNNVLNVTKFTINGVTYNAGQTANIAGVGTLVINANGTFTFTPADNYNGTVPTVTYTISDGSLTSSATLTLCVTPVNDAPVAVNDVKTAAAQTVVTGNVLTNDTDVDGDVLKVAKFMIAGSTTVYTAGQTATLTGIGTIKINQDGTYTFTPTGNYSGSLPLVTYTATDGALTSNATLSITISAPVNTAPVNTVPAALTVNEDTSLAINNISVHDADGNLATTQLTVAHGILSVSLAGGATISAGANGSASLTLAGTEAQINAALASLSYIGNANFNGTDNLVVTSTDNSGNALTNKDVDTVVINVNPVRDAAVAVDDNATTLEDNAVTGNLLTNDKNVDGLPLAVTQFAVNGNLYAAGTTATIANVGSLVIQSDGTYTFTPVANYNGTVPSITYTLSDGAATSTANLTINVTPVDDAPVQIMPDTLSATEDTANTIRGISVSDIDSNFLTTTLTATNATLTVSAIGDASISGNGTGMVTISGTAAQINAVLAAGIVNQGLPDYYGQERFTVQTSDGTNTVSDVRFINIQPQADIRADNLTTDEDTPITYNPITGTNGASADNFEGSNPMITAINGVAIAVGGSVNVSHGVVTLGPDNNLTFTPDANYFTPDFSDRVLYTYTVTSGGVTETANNTITINPVYDPYVNMTDEIVVYPNSGTFTVNLFDNDSNPDGLTLTMASVYTVGVARALVGQTYSFPEAGEFSLSADGTFHYTPITNATITPFRIDINVSDGTANHIETLLVYPDSYGQPSTENIFNQSDVTLANFVANHPDNNVIDDSATTIANYISGIQINNTIYGGSAADVILGGVVDDILFGNAGNDIIKGSAGNDVIIGGLGNDTLTGGVGINTFVWQQGEAGTTDHITDFNASPVTTGTGTASILNLADLLSGETLETLDNYLNASVQGANTVIQAHTNGTANGPTLNIVLDNVDLAATFGTTSSHDILTNLITNGNLIVNHH